MSEGVSQDWLESNLSLFMNIAYVSKIEPKKVEEALNDENWMMAMQEELESVQTEYLWRGELGCNLWVPGPRLCVCASILLARSVVVASGVRLSPLRFT